MNAVSIIARMLVAGSSLLTALAGLTTGCSGASGSQPQQDTAGMSQRPIATSDTAPAGGGSDPSGAPAPTCDRVDQGCPCDQPGEIAFCEGPVIRLGTFVTCAGLRQCVQGVWGPCVPQSYTDPGSP